MTRVSHAAFGGPGSAADLVRLLCSVAAVREGRSADVVLMADALDPVGFVREALRHRVLGIVLARLRAVDASSADRLTTSDASNFLRQQGQRNQILALHSLGVEERLRREGIPVLPLKGTDLSLRLYGTVEARSSRDIDLLVPAPALPRAVALLQGLGYDAPRDRVRRDGRPLLHFELSGPGLPRIELHWRVHWYEERFTEDLLGASALALTGRGEVPAAHEIAMLLLVYARDGFSGLKLASDVAAWWDARGAEVASSDVVELARTHPRLRRALATSATVASDVVHAPTWYSQVLAPDVSRSAVAIADWQATSSISQQTAEVALVNLILAPRPQKRAFARFELFPKADVVASWRAGTRVRWRAEMLHPVRRSVRWGYAILRHLARLRCRDCHRWRVTVCPGKDQAPSVRLHGP